MKLISVTIIATYNTMLLLLRKKRIFAPLWLGSLTFLLVACSTSSPSLSPSATSTPVSSTPSPPIPKGTILYQADWSHGLSGWQGMPGWSVFQGQLQATGNDISIIVPYKPTIPNYTIEARIQVVRLLQPHGGYFSLFAKPATGKDGYQGSINDLKGPGPNGSHPQAQALINPTGNMDRGSGRPVDYEPHAEWHIYRLEIQDNLVSLSIDGAEVSTANSNQTQLLSDGPIGLTSNGILLRVSSFRILA